MTCLGVRHPRGLRELVFTTTVVQLMPSKMHLTEMVCVCHNAYIDIILYALLNTARILTDMTAVKKFLDGFPKLKGYSISENPDTKPPGGSLFKRFKQKYDSLAKNQRVTCLAFHGTADKNISSICKNGYDPKLRSGQAYGTGEYFATTPDTPMNYCKGGKRMLLNELLLGQQGTHHTKHSVIVVMKDPAHDLPRFIVSFR